MFRRVAARPFVVLPVTRGGEQSPCHAKPRARDIGTDDCIHLYDSLHVIDAPFASCRRPILGACAACVQRATAAVAATAGWHARCGVDQRSGAAFLQDAVRGSRLAAVRAPCTAMAVAAPACAHTAPRRAMHARLTGGRPDRCLMLLHAIHSARCSRGARASVRRLSRRQRTRARRRRGRRCILHIQGAFRGATSRQTACQRCWHDHCSYRLRCMQFSYRPARIGPSAAVRGVPAGEGRQHPGGARDGSAPRSRNRPVKNKRFSYLDREW